MRTALALALVSLLSACGDRPPVAMPDVEAARTPVAPVLVPGDVHVYALDWHTEATRQVGGAQVEGGVSLQGELSVGAIAREPDGLRVAVWFSALELHTLDVQGQPLPIDAALLVGTQAEIVVDDDGDVRSARFTSASSPIFRELMTGVIARIDLRAAATDGAPHRVRSGHGLVDVTYDRREDGSVARTLADVVRFDSAPGLEVDADDLIGTGRIELDDARVPVAIELHDAALLGDDGFTADDRFSLARMRVDRATVPKAIEDGVDLDPTAELDRVAIERELDRQYAADWSLTDVQIVMNTMDGGVLPRQGEVSRSVALLRGWPEQIEILVGLVRAAGDGGRQLGFDLLAATGNAEAQDAMRRLLLEDGADGRAEYPLLLQRFAFVAAPDAKSGEFLLDRLAHARAKHDLLVVAAVLHPLGTVAGRITDVALAERMHVALVEAAADEDTEIRAAAISGLGNARRKDDVARILVATHDPDAGVRTEAVAALRTHVAPETTASLLAALADEDRGVAARALTVLRERHFEGEADPNLIERARTGQYNARIDRAMATTIAIHAKDESVRTALAAIAARTDDRDLAHVIGALDDEG